MSLPPFFQRAYSSQNPAYQKKNLTSSNTRPPQTTKASRATIKPCVSIVTPVPRPKSSVTYPRLRDRRFEFLFLFKSTFGFSPLGGFLSCISIIRSPLLWGLRLVDETSELQEPTRRCDKPHHCPRDSVGLPCAKWSSRDAGISNRDMVPI